MLVAVGASLPLTTMPVVPAAPLTLLRTTTTATQVKSRSCIQAGCRVALLAVGRPLVGVQEVTLVLVLQGLSVASLPE